ncbi:lipopolysaccharide transport periplasmic protein LptA [Streptomyces sp. NPDC097595]|uniref:lipopolysaccharide transport periplasmic protein LptA n=1 Tax=Streptomyces sp. NPDC097595 TaxID=3366090 RepID=UPI0037F29B1E
MYEDSNEPIHIVAEDTKMNAAEGTATFTGCVIVTQGGLKLEADTVVSRASDSGDPESITATGHPAALELGPTDASPHRRIKGKALKITFEPGKGLCTFEGSATGYAGDSTSRGEKVVLNLETAAFGTPRASRTVTMPTTPG